MATPIRLLVIDDHTLFRRGLVALLAQDPGLTVVGQAGDVGEALRLAQALAPDIVLLDNHLPGVRGVDAVHPLREAAPGCRVVLLTVSEDEADLSAALQAGAHGYLLKTIEADALAAAVRRVMAGEPVVSPEMTGKLVTAFQARAYRGAGPPAPAAAAPPDPLAALSPREREILTLIAHGGSNKEIARTLGIAETTVKIHVQHILRKLGLSSRVQAAVFLAGRSAGA